MVCGLDPNSNNRTQHYLKLSQLSVIVVQRSVLNVIKIASKILKYVEN